jgi:hypothetical protein
LQAFSEGRASARKCHWSWDADVLSRMALRPVQFRRQLRHREARTSDLERCADQQPALLDVIPARSVFDLTIGGALRPASIGAGWSHRATHSVVVPGGDGASMAAPDALELHGPYFMLGAIRALLDNMECLLSPIPDRASNSAVEVLRPLADLSRASMAGLCACTKTVREQPIRSYANVQSHDRTRCRPCPVHLIRHWRECAGQL